MMPLLPPGAIFHSSFSSKSRYFPLVMMSSDSPPTMVLSVSPSTFHVLLGKLSCRNPRQASVDFASKRTFHFPFFASAGQQLIANMSTKPATFFIIRNLPSQCFDHRDWAKVSCGDRLPCRMHLARQLFWIWPAKHISRIKRSATINPRPVIFFLICLRATLLETP